MKSDVNNIYLSPKTSLILSIYTCSGFGCSWQQKRQAAAPPSAAVRRRMERNRQKLVGRDKGSLTEQQTEGTGTTTIQIRRKHDMNRTTDPLSWTGLAPRGPQPQESSPPRRSPPPPEPSVKAHGMEYRALFGPVGSALTPRLCPFLESGEN